ncbi:MAG: hypothetical protein Q7K38_00480 [Candidatus Wildermuthbacteria bacterium]|nr:hypothetical protein [Candidatus Wildermuthbacteria bacterium]
MQKKYSKAWVLAVDMGYGHQRAAFALSHFASGNKVLSANRYPGIPESDKKIWDTSRKLYEIISRFKKIPVLGDIVFGIFDKFQEIQEFYPETHGIELPTLQLKQIYGFMKRRGWGKHLIEKLNTKPLPLVTTFSAVAFMAEHWGYQGAVWLVITDTDVARAWAPLRPADTNIRYCVPTEDASQRLLRYGISHQNIFKTGFPLPEELTKSAKEMLKSRIVSLDPSCRYRKLYSSLVQSYVGKVSFKTEQQPLRITFAVGGAGAQNELGKDIAKSLEHLIKDGRVQLNLVAGIRKDAADYFHTHASHANIVFAKTMEEYFETFHKTLEKTDILWTKPSELVFYAALGIPLIVAPPIGSQEVRNREWLLKIGAGIDQLDPKFTHQWLPDLLENGNFAQAAMQGFIEMEREGAENIRKLVLDP